MFFRNKNQFESALYYKEIPEEFKGKTEFIKAVSVRIEDCMYGEWDKKIDKKDIIQTYKERAVSELEKKVLSKLRKSEGDLIILKEPEFKIESFRTNEDSNCTREIALRYTYSVNGSLYKTKK